MFKWGYECLICLKYLYILDVCKLFKGEIVSLKWINNFYLSMY